LKTTQITFDWTGFFIEFADKLLTYKNNRAELLSILRYAHDEVGLRCKVAEFADIDPFTVIGTFNKGITNENRLALIKALAKRMDINATQPTNFDGIPVLMNMMAIVVWNQEDISDVWNLFESAINFADSPNEHNIKLFIKWYDTVSKHKGISWNLTVGLYWIRPYSYLNLDSVNRSFLHRDIHFEKIKGVSKLKRVPDATTYLKIIELCRKSFSEGELEFSSFPELSLAAWSANSLDFHSQDKKLSQANFLQWFEPLIQALKDLGGSATPDAARKQIITNLNLPNEIVSETRGKTGAKRFDNEVAFARNYLAYEGIIDKSVHGTWMLTEKGKSITMTHELASEIFYKWAKILRERRENASENDVTERETNERRYWLYIPGKDACNWDEFYEQGIIGIGWDEMQDLTLYPNRESMREKMKELFGIESKHTNSSLATWQFVHTMRKGDIVYAKKGLYEMIGVGIVESDYIFMPKRDECRNIRKIKWTHKGNWVYPEKTIVKTLTDVSSYTDYLQKLELLIIGDSEVDALESEIEVEYEKYSDDDFLSDVFIESEQYETLVNLLKNKKNLILQGAPGVGKTFAAKLLAYSIIGVKDTSRVMTVQFHQSYSYEDFIVGFRPTKDGFELAQGPFYTFCKNAQDDLERDYFFIIDEINRGNLSKIFGELLMLIENDKRGDNNKLRLLYSNEQFSVPDNVYIIGLMNTADRSLAMIDYALRRRFAFYEMEPAFESAGFLSLIESSGNDKFARLIECVKELNEVIAKDESLGVGFRIGHSYFCTEREITDHWLASVVSYEILPLLREYWFDEKAKIESWTKKLCGVLND